MRQLMDYHLKYNDQNLPCFAGHFITAAKPKSPEWNYLKNDLPCSGHSG